MSERVDAEALATRVESLHDDQSWFKAHALSAAKGVRALAAERDAAGARAEKAEREREAILQQARGWALEAKTQRATVNEVGAALGGVPDWGPIAAGVESALRDRDALRAEVAKLRDFLEECGYRRCDIPACNCNSFHGGHAQNRLSEIHDALAELMDMNGKTILEGIAALAADRDTLRAEVERLRGEIDCACNALIDSICASGNDATTNLAWVRRLHKAALAPARRQAQQAAEGGGG